MKKIIITGGSGFLGSKLAETLTEANYEVLALGRKKFNEINEIRKDRLSGSTYLRCDLSKENLYEILENAGWSSQNIYAIFHLAWGGESGLSDLNSTKQFENLPISLKLFENSKSLGIKKFIYTGTMEEFFAEQYINLDYKQDSLYNRHVLYALAKLWTRRSLKIKAINSEIDTLFITNSHIIGPGDDKDSFLQVSLSKMIHNQPITMSSGVQLFDVIDVVDCAEAYLSVLKNGKNLGFYMAGSGNPHMLKIYILEMRALFPEYNSLTIDSKKFADVVLEKSFFDTSNLVNDTGFVPKITFKESLVCLREYIEKYKIIY